MSKLITINCGAYFHDAEEETRFWFWKKTEPRPDTEHCRRVCHERFSWLFAAQTQWQYVDNDNASASVWFYDLFISQLLLSFVRPRVGISWYYGGRLARQHLARQGRTCPGPGQYHFWRKNKWEIQRNWQADQLLQVNIFVPLQLHSIGKNCSKMDHITKHFPNLASLKKLLNSCENPCH